jgi:hypothetical protein
MKTNIEIKADILKTLMAEDRQEVRGIRATIYNVVTLLSTLSFGISSFLLGKQYHQATVMCLATDALIVLLLWIFFARLKGDLYCCRQCLVARQNLIRKMDQNDTEDLDPFPDARNVIPDVSDSELWWIPILATAVIALKALVIWLLQSP